VLSGGVNGASADVELCGPCAADLIDAGRAERIGPFAVRMRVNPLSVNGSHYPAGWPRCACGEPVMDGHLTCGQARCGTQAQASAIAGLPLATSQALVQHVALFSVSTGVSVEDASAFVVGLARILLAGEEQAVRRA
jgi:hypothetical protein